MKQYEIWVDETAEKLLVTHHDDLRAFVKNCILTDVGRMPKSRWRKWKRNPDTIQWKQWRPEAIERRISLQLRRMGSEIKYAHRVVAGAPPAAVVGGALKRIGRILVTAAPVITTVLLKVSPEHAGSIFATLGAVTAAAGGEKAAREIMRGKVGDPNASWIAILLTVIKMIWKWIQNQKAVEDDK